MKHSTSKSKRFMFASMLLGMSAILSFAALDSSYADPPPSAVARPTPDPIPGDPWRNNPHVICTWYHDLPDITWRPDFVTPVDTTPVTPPSDKPDPRTCIAPPGQVCQPVPDCDEITPH